MRLRHLTLLPLFVVLLACADEPAPGDESPATRPYIVAVNNPLYYFATRLVGEKVEVRLPVPADIDPATWQPAVADVLELQGAELVLLNGAGYSGWLDRVSLAPGRLVVTSEPARQQWIELAGQVTHSHGPEGAHAHGGYAFTTWMDLSLARVQAEVVAEALMRRWPASRDTVTGKRDALLADLDALDAGYREQAARLAGRQMIYSHPVYAYFQRRYDLAGESLHWEPDVMPSAAQWEELERLRTQETLFLWEGEPEGAIGERMTAMGLEYAVVDPAANRGQRGDWLAVQRDNLRRLGAVGVAAGSAPDGGPLQAEQPAARSATAVAPGRGR